MEETTKVKSVTDSGITFENGIELTSDHQQDCCENHYLHFSDLTMNDFEGLEFDLSGESFFERVEGYGIRLLPTNGHAVSVPGYGYNNGYYGSNIDLCLSDGRRFDVSDCQVIEE